MDALTILIIVHTVGTVLGVGGATFIEIFLNKALKDGEIDPIESSFLQTTFTVVRWGLIISLISGFGFLLLYKFNGQAFRLYDPTLWAKLTIIIIIAINALLLQAHKISLFWGSAFSFVSWYAALLLGVFLSGPSPNLSYLTIMAIYFAVVIVGAFILKFIRKLLGVKI